MTITGKLLVTGLFAAAFASGQRGGGMGEGGEGMGGGGGRGGMMQGPSMGPARKTRMELFSEILKLNKDQKKEVKAAMDDGQKEAAPIREEMAKSRLQIAEAVASGKSQDEIHAAVKAYAALEAQMAALELRTFTKIYLSLDKEQKARSAPVFQMMAGVFLAKSWNET